MPDFKLVENGYFYDFEIDEYGHVTDGIPVEEAVKISIFTDRRAEQGDEVLDGDYKGWWGDTYNDSKIGSRLWTLRRRKATPSVLREAKQIIEQSLKWLIDDGVASGVDVYNEWSLVNRGRMNMLIKVYKPNGEELEFKFNEQWGVTG